MSVALARPGNTRRIEIGPLLAAAGVLAALLIGLAFGVPTFEQRILGAAVCGAVAILAAVAWPFRAVQMLFFSVICLIVWVVIGARSVNFLDLLLIPTFLVSVLGAGRRRALVEDAGLVGPAHAQIRDATRRLSRSVRIFYGLAALSLVALAVRGHPRWALDSSLLLFRGLQGLSLFALGLWWMRTDDDVRGGMRAVEAGAWALLGLNTFYFLFAHIHRAGMTWIVNLPEWPMSSPNEAAASLVVIQAVIQSVPSQRRRLSQWILNAGILVLLVMTQSRSGLVAWTVYNLLSLRWRRWSSYIWILIVVAIGLPFVPAAYWQRIFRTLSLTGGTFDAYSSLMRFYSWQMAVRIFLDHPIFGAGYVGLRFITPQYNPFHIVLATAESFYLEIAADMGLIGLAALAPALVAFFRLGAAVKKVVPPGSLGYELARRHRPLVLAMLAANVTGDNFIGMVGLGQMAIWCALLIRAGHLSVARAESPA